MSGTAEINAELAQLAADEKEIVAKRRRLTRQLDALRIEKSRATKADLIEKDGFYRFSDVATLHLVRIEGAWREVGEVVEGTREDSECGRGRICSNPKCRFKIEGVVPARRTPLYNVPLDPWLKINYTLCEYCRAEACSLLNCTEYYRENYDEGDDGYGGYVPRDYYKKPFCAIPFARAADDATRRALLNLALDPPAPAPAPA